jgi:DNA-directed RNA polymerase specialized sigma24 family protein
LVTVTDDSIETLKAFQARMDAMPSRRAELIAQARTAGHSWREIGAAIGMSHAGAMKAARVG